MLLCGLEAPPLRWARVRSAATHGWGPCLRFAEGDELSRGGDVCEIPNHNNSNLPSLYATLAFASRMMLSNTTLTPIMTSGTPLPGRVEAPTK
jgi:hypothetical protein